MYGEPDYGYWNGDGYLNLSGTRKRITNNYVVDDTPSDYIFLPFLIYLQFPQNTFKTFDLRQLLMKLSKL